MVGSLSRTRAFNALFATPPFPLLIYIHCLHFIVAYLLIMIVLSGHKNVKDCGVFLELRPLRDHIPVLPFTPNCMAVQALICLAFISNSIVDFASFYF